MSIAEIISKFTSDILITQWQEWVSTITQIASVWYARKNNILVFPTGIIGVLLAAWMYLVVANPPLYADGLLNIYYFGMSLYGWYNWVQKNNEQKFTFPISYCSKNELILGIGFFLASWILIFLLLKYGTNSNTPILDSLVSGSAITAMLWMAKRKIENWWAWIFSNIVAIPLNFYKGFMLFTVMYILFLWMAYLGYQSWKKELRNV
jgi:nicotinamide mononucleotide transporter